MSSASPSPFCSACGARLGTTDRFCPTCGAAVAAAGETAPGVVRNVVNKTGEVALDTTVDAGVSGALEYVRALIPTVVPAALLKFLSDSSQSFLAWFALTWPLTLAAAAIVVVQQRSTRGSLSIVPIGIAILLAATWLGVTLAGTPINLMGSPTGAISLLLYLVRGYLSAFGTIPFILSIAAGGLAGFMLTRLIKPVAANANSTSGNA